MRIFETTLLHDLSIDMYKREKIHVMPQGFPRIPDMLSEIGLKTSTNYYVVDTIKYKKNFKHNPIILFQIEGLALHFIRLQYSYASNEWIASELNQTDYENLLES